MMCWDFKDPFGITRILKNASVITQVFLFGCGLHRLKKGRKISSSDPERSPGSGIFADRMAFTLAGSRTSHRFHTLLMGNPGHLGNYMMIIVIRSDMPTAYRCDRAVRQGGS
jgi:hypothetical protein